MGLKVVILGRNGRHWGGIGPIQPWPNWGPRRPDASCTATQTIRPSQSILVSARFILGAQSPFPVHAGSSYPSRYGLGHSLPFPSVHWEMPSSYWEPHSLSQYKPDIPYPFPVCTGYPQPLPSPHWEPPAPSQSILGDPTRQFRASGLFTTSAPDRPGSLPWVFCRGVSINKEGDKKAPRVGRRGQELVCSGPYWENPYMR